MRCKRCHKTFKHPPLNMRKTQMCSLCQSFLNIIKNNENGNVTQNYNLASKINEQKAEIEILKERQKKIDRPFMKKNKNLNKISKAKLKTETAPSPKPSNQLNFPQIRKEFFMMLKEDSKNLKLFENIEKHLSAIPQNKLREIMNELKN